MLDSSFRIIDALFSTWRTLLRSIICFQVTLLNYFVLFILSQWRGSSWNLVLVHRWHCGRRWWRPC
jgi:Na+/glutamate symporter